MPAPRKRKPQSRQAEPSPPVLRGFVCAPNFGPWDKIGPRRALYFAAEFRNGRRVPGIALCEWDFRGIATAEEAREAVLYEYAREVEWIYDYHAEFFALVTHPEGSTEAKHAAENFKSRWTINGGSPDPLFGQLQGNVFFPLPWMTLEDRRPPTIGRGTGIRSLTPADFKEPAGSPRLGRHALQIDWSVPRSRLVSAFKKWMRENRPKDVRERKQSGTDPKDIFAKLKRLAAYRLKRAGLSRSKALELIREETHAVPASNSFDVLPNYSSEGRWSSSAKEAAEYLTRWFPVPRAGEIPELWPDDPRH